MTAAIDLSRYKPLARKTSIPVVEGRLIEVVETDHQWDPTVAMTSVP